MKAETIYGLKKLDPIACEFCKKTLEQNPDLLLVLFYVPQESIVTGKVRTPEHDHYFDGYVGCKLDCDRELKAKIKRPTKGIDKSIQVTDFCVPCLRMVLTKGYMDGLQNGVTWDDAVYQKMVNVVNGTMPYVVRSPNDDDVEAMKSVYMI